MSPKKSVAKKKKTQRSKKTGLTRGKASKYKKQEKSPSQLAEVLVDKIFNEAYRMLSLDFLSFKKDEAKRLLKELVEPLITTSTKPDTLVKRLQRYRDNLLKMVIHKVLEKGSNGLTPEQLEFIVLQGGEALLPHIPVLYRLLDKMGLHHLIPVLRNTWEKYGNPTPLSCPYCGFKSVTPMLQCVICGREIPEKELKEYNDFKTHLQIFAETAPPDDIEEAVKRRRVLWGKNGIVVAKQQSLLTGWHTEITLTRDEIDYLKSMLSIRYGKKFTNHHRD